MDFNSFLMGSIAGTCGVVSSHPFDTYKTLLQTRKEGERIKVQWTPRFFYRGVDKAIYGMAMEKCFVFGGWHNAKKYTDNDFVAGCFAGLLASTVVTPTERLKILCQTNQNTSVLSILKTKNLSYFYQGFFATTTREIPGFGIYFSVYEYLKNKYSNNLPIDVYKSFLFGATAGTTAWIFIYPQDTIKTIIQSSADKKLDFISTGKKLVLNGYMNLYKGFSFCLLRVIPLHGTVFTAMELLKKYF
jgi:hypothetical protein